MEDQKGFIQIPLLISIILGAIIIGGGSYFAVSKYQASQDKGQEINKLRAEVESLKITKENQAAEGATESKKMEAPRIVERIIEKPVIVEKQIPAVSAPIQQVAVPATEDPKKSESVAFNAFWQNYDKAINELNAATRYRTDALNSFTNGTKEISVTYSQNAIDSCNSAAQINIANQVPSLPFNQSLSDLNKIVSSLAVKCKQFTQASNESLKYVVDIHADGYNPYKAKDLALESDRVFNEYLNIWDTQLKPKHSDVVNKANEYFK